MDDHSLDVTSEPDPAPQPDARRSRPGRSRPFLGVRFACCGVYARVFPNRDQTAYVAHCPRCLKKLEIAIGPGGADQRFFTAY